MNKEINTTGLELIGTGLFSKVYALNDKKVLIDTCCPCKAAMQEFPSSKYFPKIELQEVLPTNRKLYTMKRYSKTRSLKNSLKPKQYELYKELRTVFLSSWNCSTRTALNRIQNKRVRELLLQAYDTCICYGDEVKFEISPRNVAVHNGNLVLLDVFFCNRMARKVRGF